MIIDNLNIFGKRLMTVRFIIKNLLKQPKNLMKKRILFVIFIWFYLYYKSRKRKVKKVFKRTAVNKDIMANLQTIINEYKPTFYLPIPFLQILRSAIHSWKSCEFIHEIMVLPDGGEIMLDWYPKQPTTDRTDKPIVLFVPGLCGNKKSHYLNDLACYVDDMGWTIVSVNRRGFGLHKLNTPTFIPKDEVEDLEYLINRFRKIYPSNNIYLLGVSAGANFSVRYLGQCGKEDSIKASVAISNPFSIGKISFTMKYNKLARLYSGFMAKDMQDLFRYHKDCPHFRENVKQVGMDVGKFEKKLKKKTTCWKVDKFFTSKLGNFNHVLEYYHNISSEHVISDIKIPTLFIQNQEDPICLKEMIPVENIYRNQNTILLLTERGGHIEYFSGWKMDYWGFKTALYYFNLFEEKSK